MFPIVTVPEIIRQGLAPYRSLFCRDAGFEHIGRYVTGLILSPNKTLQGIYALQVWEDSTHPSRRAMHETIFEAGWDAAALMPHHRKLIAPAHRGRAVLSLDWTYAHGGGDDLEKMGSENNLVYQSHELETHGRLPIRPEGFRTCGTPAVSRSAAACS